MRKIKNFIINHTTPILGVIFVGHLIYTLINNIKG